MNAFQAEIYDYDKRVADESVISAFRVVEICPGVYHIYVELDIKDVYPQQFSTSNNEMEIDLYPRDEDRLVVLRVKAKEPTVFFYNHVGRGIHEFIAILKDKYYRLVGCEQNG